MSSAVQALLDGHTPAAAHGKRSAYRTWCACCDPEPEVAESKRPVLAWRTRLAAQQARAQSLNEPQI